MRFLLRLPLHYQILVALVLGTAIGVAINPGEVPLEGTIEGRLVPSDGGVLLTETDDQGDELIHEALPSDKALRQRYPKLAEEYLAHEPRQEVRFPVTDARVHIVEDGRSVTLTYTRRHDGQLAVSTFKADASDEFVHSFPEWAAIYKKHGDGVRRKISAAAKFVGDLFLRLLQMITIPLIVTSLVTGVTGLGDTQRFGKMFGRTLLYYLSTSMLAIATGLVMVNLIRPGEGAILPGGGEPVVGGGESVGGIFRGLAERMIPTNPIESLAGGEFLSIITFSILLGIFIIYTGGKSGQVLRDLFEAGFHVMMKLTMAIIALAPIGVFAFMLFATSTQGIDIFKSLAWYMATVFLGLVVHA
jgi:Sodium:dicarboxylate symporter family